MNAVCLIDDFEKEAETWELKFPRKYRAEKIRGLPSMRGLFDDLFKKHQKPPNPTLFAEKVWEHSTGIKPELKEDVMARARRAHPSFVREAHFQLVLKTYLLMRLLTEPLLFSRISRRCVVSPSTGRHASCSQRSGMPY